MAYAESTPELEAIETDSDTVTDALEQASSMIDGYLCLYETPADTEDAGLLARLRRWCLSLAAGILTANRPGQSEKVMKDYDVAVAELERVRAGFVPLSLARLEAPVIVRGW